ncbi:MAG: 2-amino-4-oxopentanoate thiolase subunit OrtA [Eubacteriales bacterium]|nr:2-amino-4-oxopentanoate thiolase subunit OrtA [Eubacteriales bacterium]MDD4389230.1 2-amino-4-oxopentanoate thiolase subunit OrtA [Eubacteriales bacterium]
MVSKGTFVRIEKTILEPQERTSKIPDDTKKVPFKMWTKGVLQHDCELNAEATIVTVANRRDTGKLVEVNPFYELNYGEFLPEITEIDRVIKNERK